VKIDLSNKRNLIILASLAGVAFAAALFFVVFSGGPKVSEEARRAEEAREARGPLPRGAEVEGMPATPDAGGPGPEGDAGAAPEGPEMAAAGPAEPAGGPGEPPAGTPAGPDEGSAPEAQPAPKPFEAEGDGGTIPKGPPVEPYRPDPFVTAAKLEAPRPTPVLPPLVVVRQPPQPMVVPATVNVIPTSIIARGSAAIRAEVQRRLSGVLWNGKVFAILESSDEAQRAIVQPGEQVGKDLWVKSISRSQMVLVREDGERGREEIVVDLKEAQRQPAMGLGPGGMPGMPGDPGAFPGGMPAP